MKIYLIVCYCNMELEVEENGTVKCPDCGREYDDAGNQLYKAPRKLQVEIN